MRGACGFLLHGTIFMCPDNDHVEDDALKLKRNFNGKADACLLSTHNDLYGLKCRNDVNECSIFTVGTHAVENYILRIVSAQKGD